ncbi:MAG: ATP-binding cassette domain-containing protein [Peptoniphilus sp.]|nr:ATP-binding cassette domain-containing protein [Peptoniphilus sp.]MDY3119265.1 ATP-binding cassette domain-containing protein [Peptoniphilus sp.]
MNKLLTIDNLKKTYDGKKVLDVDHFDLPAGAIYGLIGPNGAGKSTLMKAILGLIQIDGGYMVLFGEKVTPKNQKFLNRKLGALIERPTYYDHLTGQENLSILCTLKGMDKKHILPALEAVGLEAKAGDKVRTYSLGMKQRLGIAMAIIGEPKLLILDEPINGLDPVGTLDMRRLFQHLAEVKKTTILISSHILDEVEKIATHIAMLQKGRLLYDGTLEDYRRLHPPILSIRTSNNQKAAEVLSSARCKIRGDRLILNHPSDTEVAKVVHALSPHVDIYRIEEERESLEALFIQDTQKGGASID